MPVVDLSTAVQPSRGEWERVVSVIFGRPELARDLASVHTSATDSRSHRVQFDFFYTDRLALALLQSYVGMATRHGSIVLNVQPVEPPRSVNVATRGGPVGRTVGQSGIVRVDMTVTDREIDIALGRTLDVAADGTTWPRLVRGASLPSAARGEWPVRREELRPPFNPLPLDPTPRISDAPAIREMYEGIVTAPPALILGDATSPPPAAAPPAERWALLEIEPDQPGDAERRAAYVAAELALAQARRRRAVVEAEIAPVAAPPPPPAAPRAPAIVVTDLRQELADGIADELAAPAPSAARIDLTPAARSAMLVA